MKNLLILPTICFVLVACAPTSQSEQSVKEAVTNHPSAFSRPVVVTVRPPVIPIGPITGNPAFPVPTPTPFSIEGWQNFTSYNIGVAVGLPSDWSITEQADGAIFTSPEGAKILLMSTLGSRDMNGSDNSSQQCTTLINSYKLTINTCFDPASHDYLAEFKIIPTSGGANYATISTKEDPALDVYRKMLNTLHLTQ